MDGGKYRFASLADAVAALYATPEPMLLTRFEPAAAERVVIAVNAAAACSARGGDGRNTRCGNRELNMAYSFVACEEGVDTVALCLGQDEQWDGLSGA
jgi:hypothetical protein